MENKKTKLAAILAVSVILLGACKKMETIKLGSKVDFNYTLKVDGAVVESSFDKKPLTYEHGKGGIIKGLEEALAGLKQGDKKTVTIPPDKAYGVRNEKAVMNIPKASIKEADKLKEGNMISFMQGERKFNALVSEISDDTVTLDYNHPMAGKTLTFDVEIVKIENPVNK